MVHGFTTIISYTKRAVVFKTILEICQNLVENKNVNFMLSVILSIVVIRSLLFQTFSKNFTQFLHIYFKYMHFILPYANFKFIFNRLSFFL